MANMEEPLQPQSRSMRRRIEEKAHWLHLQDEKRADERKITKYRCPCAECHGGGRPVLRATIQTHLRRVGRDPNYMRTVLVNTVTSL